jgi:hypothetical protein
MSKRIYIDSPNNFVRKKIKNVGNLNNFEVFYVLWGKKVPKILR